MRVLLYTFVSLAAAGAASASSIEVLTTKQDDAKSISKLSCPQCPPLVVEKKNTYVVPEIAEGTEKVELKEINGEMKLVRTEAWLGGSPVVFISKASDEAIKAAAATQPGTQTAATTAADPVPAQAQATADVAIIDGMTKTGAVATASVASMAAVTPQDSRSQEVDLKNFQLRLK